MAKAKEKTKKTTKRKMRPIIIDQETASSWLDNPLTWVAGIVLVLLLIALLR